MARPMLLLPKNLLKQCADQNAEGVPVSFLVRKYELDITHPTLAKLIKHYETMMLAKITGQDEIHEIMYASLFPDWVTVHKKANNTLKQPSSVKYIGKFPLGEWVDNDWAID